MTESIFLALDFPSWQEAGRFLEIHDLHGVPVKVGMELYYREGPQIIEKLKKNGHSIFLDLKLHDIPTTVKRAMNVIASLEVDMVNVHALGSSEMIQSAKEGLQAGNSSYETKLIAVTILTTMDNRILNEELLIPGEIKENAVHFAGFAKDHGADGVVCSVYEAANIKNACGSEFATVTPGIRLINSDLNDQKRVATPGYARQNGSDYLVIGRSVTQADDPKKAYKQAVKEWEEGKCN